MYVCSVCLKEGACMCVCVCMEGLRVKEGVCVYACSVCLKEGVCVCVWKGCVSKKVCVCTYECVSQGRCMCVCVWKYVCVHRCVCVHLFVDGFRQSIMANLPKHIYMLRPERYLTPRACFSHRPPRLLPLSLGLQPSQETQTVASITYQSFFRLYKTLSGMSGTANTEAKEFADIYGLPVTCIPTALPVARRDNPDAVFRTQNGKWKAVMGDIARRHTKGLRLFVIYLSMYVCDICTQTYTHTRTHTHTHTHTHIIIYRSAHPHRYHIHPSVAGALETADRYKW